MSGASPPPIVGVFVGGRSRRMGGRPKGLLVAPGGGETLLSRLLRVSREAGLEPVLVGEATPYAALAPEVPRLADDPPGVGPLGGLSAVLAHAGERPVVTVACDMPYVTVDVLTRLRLHPSAAPALCPRREGGPFEPLLARWDPPRVRPALEASLAAGERSFQRLLARLEVEALPVDPTLARALRDWDAPSDVSDDPV